MPPLSDEVKAILEEKNIDFETSGLKYLTNEARVSISIYPSGMQIEWVRTAWILNIEWEDKGHYKLAVCTGRSDRCIILAVHFFSCLVVHDQQQNNGSKAQW